MNASEDQLLRFLSGFAAMSEPERDAAIGALSAEQRDALLALADARKAAAGADLVAVLDAGHGGLDMLYRVTEPADLFAAISLAVRERPELVVEALFAAVVAHRGWAGSEPAAVAALREQWIWHVHERVVAAGTGDAQERDRRE